MNLLIRQVISDTYAKLGNLTRADLPMEVVLPLLYDIVNSRLIEAGLSDSDQLLKSTEKAITDQDMPLSISDFGFLHVVLMFRPGSERTFEVHQVPFSEISKCKGEGLLRCNVYGTPPRIVFSLDPLPRFNRMQVWYEPGNPQARGTDQEVAGIPPIFRGMLSDELAWLCIPYVQNQSPEVMVGIGERLGIRYAQLADLWDRYLMSARLQKGTINRRPFRAGAVYRYRG